MKQKFRATIGRKCYQFCFEEPEPDQYAVVDYTLRRVSIAPMVNDKPQKFRVEILLHEALHVLAPEWKEKKVLEAGRDLARLLVTAGEMNDCK